jgi:hypothetical protein
MRAFFVLDWAVVPFAKVTNVTLHTSHLFWTTPFFLHYTKTA